MIEKNVFGYLMEHNDITTVNMKKRGWGTWEFALAMVMESH